MTIQRNREADQGPRTVMIIVSLSKTSLLHWWFRGILLPSAPIRTQMYRLCLSVCVCVCVCCMLCVAWCILLYLFLYHQQNLRSKITNSMQLSTTREAPQLLGHQIVSKLLWKQKVQYRFHKSSSPVPNLSIVPELKIVIIYNLIPAIRRF
jgi:hypothetical protein